MEKMDGILSAEDYLEPRCPLDMRPPEDAVNVPAGSIPQHRVIEKMDEYMSRRDYAGAERHLLYWQEEARALGDLPGELMVRNELTGHYRKTGEKQKSLENAEKSLALAQRLGFDGTVTAGTTLINAATAFHAFGNHTRAIELFRRAQAIYEQRPETKKELLGGLYNNMGLACSALRDFPEAFRLFGLAMDVMEQVEGGELEQAITLLNIAGAIEEQAHLETAVEDEEGEDTAESQDAASLAESRIRGCLERAYSLLTNPVVRRDGYCAFVYEKCAPGFGWHGYFLEEQALRRAAEEIYAGS